jgi:transposase
MFRPYDQQQSFLLPPSLSEFLDEAHPAHAINDIVDRLDLSRLESRYGHMGQPAYHPRMMVKVILYGFTVGIFSSRKLQRACQENLAFKFLAGMETPAFKTFVEFRKRHRSDMKTVFAQTVKVARELGLARLGAVALDGCKIDADTSKHKAMSYGRMKEEERKLRAEIEGMLKRAEATDASEDDENGPDDDGYRLGKELSRREERLAKIEEAKAALEEREGRDHPGEEIDEKKQISFADPDARCHAKPGDGARYVYNAQAAVDMGEQIIVENHIEDSVQDAHAGKHALETMKAELGEMPKKLVADAGYANKITLESCRENEVVPVCALGREGKESQLSKVNAMEYNLEQDRFTCPHGQTFDFRQENPKDGRRSYHSRAVVTCTCGHEELKDGRAALRVYPSQFAKRELRRIMDEPDNRNIYRRRKCTVEPVFGQIQVGMGFRRFFYRGRQNVGSEWNLLCAAFNVKKIAAVMRRRAGVWGRILSKMDDYVRSARHLVGRTALHIAPTPQPA